MNVTVGAVMTAPRYECVAARNVIESSLREAGVPLSISGGVYYGQCMQIMLEDLISQGVNYALTVDFDSIFLAADARRLIDIIAQESGIDALSSVQPKRSSGAVMASNGKAEELQWNGYPLRVQTAHFGLTVIDLEKLAEVPKPWFMALPDADGRWGDSRTDADVYFWKRWRESGHTLFIDPGVKLGHLEEMVTVFDDQMNLQHKYLKDWKHDASQADENVERISGGPLADASRRSSEPAGRADEVCGV